MNSGEIFEALLEEALEVRGLTEICAALTLSEILTGERFGNDVQEVNPPGTQVFYLIS